MNVERFFVSVASGAAGSLQPGAILRALSVGAGIAPESVGRLTPMARGRVEARLATAAAASLPTPFYLVDRSGDDPVIMHLARPDDVPSEGTLTLILNWNASEAAPSPGAIAIALSSATGGHFGAEELGMGVVGAGWAHIHVPGRVALGADLPPTLDAGGVIVNLTTAPTGGGAR